VKKNLSLSLALVLVSSFAVAADHLSSTVTMSSNYIFRAMSYNSQGAVHQGQGSPVVQGSVDYVHEFEFANFGGSFFIGPADTFNTQALVMEKDSEADTFLFVSKSLTEDLGATVGYNYYTFMKNVDNDMGEISASVNYKKLKLSNGYTERFSGVDTNQNRTLLAFTPELYSVTTTAGANTLSLDLRVARNFFSNPAAVATSSYYDYLTGLVFNVEGFVLTLAYTNTFDRVNLITNEYAKNTDGTFSFSVSKTFSLF
jgi:uncharacterized protein (TIGR02001 family)